MPTMEFWGVEVRAGGYRMPASVDYLMHLSQAALGESKNKAESVTLYVKFDDQQLVLGTLSHQNLPQMSFDLVFEKAFELSHDWKDGTVHFCGYKAEVPTPYPFICGKFLDNMLLTFSHKVGMRVGKFIIELFFPFTFYLKRWSAMCAYAVC
ncbi:hypothetical protein SLEP1_g12112 [Rubroshorea leprosula]|nr:hypothetical protein SLEP1_g12112 [Rubroshorea leprosula]